MSVRLPLFSLLVLLFAVSSVVHAQGSTQYQWQRPPGTAAAELRLGNAQGESQSYRFEAGESILIDAYQLRGGDGLYHWELISAPQVPGSLRDQAAQSRQQGQTEAPANWPAAIPVQRGVLFVQGGAFVSPELEAEEPGAGAGELPGGTRAPPIAGDQTIRDSLCVGRDCLDAESFGSDTIRLKENNLRIHIDDTSNSSSFPANDWRLIFNDAIDGGSNHFSLEDATAGRAPFRVDAGAPTSSLRVNSNGNVGLGTAVAVLDLHVRSGNTPAMRLEQDNVAGFTAQTWDIGANETNFFVRDVTSGSRLPFRISPGAGTSSIHIHGDGDVGMGIGNSNQMAAALHLRRNAAYTESLLLIDRPDDLDPLTEERALELDSAGNLFVGGSITQLSSRHSKENLVAVAGSALLERLRGLDLWTWNYLGASTADRHIGPVAEDFYAMFGLGQSARSLAPADVAGVALAASQALSEEIEIRDRHIAELEARIQRLEAAMERMSSQPR